jgi:hypothetical protein
MKKKNLEDENARPLPETRKANFELVSTKLEEALAEKEA